METKDNQEIQEDLSNNVSLEKPKKEKKPRSEKQLAHFQNMAQKRKKNIEQKKLEKKIESARLLIEHDIQVAPTPSQTPVKSKTKKVVEKVEEDDEDDDDDEEVQEVVTKRKPKTKAKKIIVYQESESESESEEEQKPQSRKLKT